MIENVGRKIALIVVALLASLALILPGGPSLRMGLDLAGGQRLVYQFDFDQAERDGLLPAGTSRTGLIEETIQIIRMRVDPDGVIDPVIRKAGEEQIEINIPGSARRSTARADLADEVAGEGDARLQPIRISTANPEDIKRFPGGGGVISIGQEKIRYSRRADDQLIVDQRGYGRTEIAAHQGGDPVILVSDDQVRAAIENLGDLRFMKQAEPTDFTLLESDETTERQRLTDWLAAPENGEAPISAFNALPRDQGGPVAGIQWFPSRLADGAPYAPPRDRTIQPFLTPTPESNFSTLR